MTKKRVSNEQVLEAINTQAQAIDRLINVLAGASAPAPVVQTQAPKPVVVDETPVTTDIPTQYLQRMTVVTQDKCNGDGVERVLYATKNTHGEPKLRYIHIDKYPSLRDPRLLGAIKTISPQA